MTEPSEHRQLMLKIARQLTKQDVDEIVYLSGDCIPTIGSVPSHMDLIRGLEQQGLLRQGHYAYLLSCLRAVGRIDLEATIMLSLIPSLRASFGVPQQLLSVKMDSIGRKRGQFVNSMCYVDNLRSKPREWAKYINRKYSSLFSALTTPQVVPERSEIAKVSVTTLDHLARSLVVWEKANVDFAQHHDYSKVLEDVHRVGAHAKKFITALDSISWRKEWRSHEIEEIYQVSPLYHASLRVSTTLREFASDLLFGECALQQASDKPVRNLHAIQFYAVREFIIILHWLMTLMEFAAHSDVDVESYKECFRSMIEHHKPRITANGTFLRQLLKDTTLLKKIESEGVVNLADDGCSARDSIVALERAVLPIVYPLTLLALMYSEDFTPKDWSLLQARMERHFVPHREKMVEDYTGLCLSTAHNFGKEFGRSLRQSIDSLDVAPDARKLVADVFHYENAV